MPIYEYHCEACGTDFQELLFSRSDMDSVRCRSCGSEKIVKLMSGAAVHTAASTSCGAASKCPAFDPSGRGGCPGGNCCMK